MAESAALVPIPFYPPVMTGTGWLFKFGKTPRGPLLPNPRAGRVASDPDEGSAYSRNGHFIADTRVGRRVDIYI